MKLISARYPEPYCISIYLEVENTSAGPILIKGPGGQPTLKVAGWAGKRSPGTRAAISGAGL